MTKEFKDMKGVIAIATTPFNNENLIDFESVDRLSNYYIESKVSGVTILGVMGEAHKLNIEEQKTLIKRYVNNLINSVPVIVGVSNAGLDNLELLSKFSMDSGASGVMVSGNNGLKNDDQIKSYFNQVVKGLNKNQIIDNMQKRVNNSKTKEFETAISEIHKIAELRIKDLTY